MSGFLDTLPTGFGAGIEGLSIFPTDLLRALVLDVVGYVAYKVAVVSPLDYVQALLRRDIAASTTTVTAAANALTWLLRRAAAARVLPAEFEAACRGSGVFAPAVLRTVTAVWADQAQALDSDASLRQLLSIGQLLKAEWKAGIGVSSSGCARLQAPFVVLAFTVRDAHTDRTVAVELSHHQFQDFAKTVREIDTVLSDI